MVATDLIGGCGSLAEGEREIAGGDRRHEVILHEHIDALDRGLGEDEDRGGDAARAQLHPFVDRGDSQLVGAGGEHGLSAGDGSVAVGVGLDDGHELHGAGEKRFESAGVAAECGEIDLDPRPTRLGSFCVRHFLPPCPYSPSCIRVSG